MQRGTFGHEYEHEGWERWIKALGIAGMMLACVAAQGREIEVGADKALKTIGEALKGAQGGDVITVGAGVYREAVALNVSGTAEHPTVLRAAPGARVVISGFEEIKGWKDAGNGIYTATVEGPVSDLFVGLSAQPISRWPDPELPMRRLGSTDKAAWTFKDAAGLDAAALKAAAAAPKGLMAFLYFTSGNVFGTVPVKGLDLAGGNIELEKSGSVRRLKGAGDRYQLINHPSLIARAGEWAFESAGEGKVTIHFKPKRAADLERTQYRKLGTRGLVRIGGSGKKTEHVCLEGLEVCGSMGKGVEIGGASGVTVTRCIMHHNDGNGLGVRRCDHINIINNISLVNHATGIGIASSHDVLVEGNEIAFNAVDGLTVAGNITGKPQGEPETFDVTVRRNYIHHHMLLSHPDNLQTYRGVHRLTLEDNVLLWGGQGIMTEETETAALRGSVVVGTAAIAVIFGHGNSNGWTVERSTVGLGGWGAFSFSGKDYRVHDSIVWENPMSHSGNVESHHNLYYRADAAAPIYIVSKPKWKRFESVAEAAKATGQEQGSLRAEPKFRNAPAFQAPALWADENTRSYLKLRSADFGTFEKGDKIEINGDGVLRSVTEAEGETIKFEPELPARPFRETLVWNWKKAEKAELDLRVMEGSPALTAGEGGKAVGAQLDIAAFKRGEFGGDGKRAIPELPEDLKAALPDPNAVALPVYGQ